MTEEDSEEGSTTIENNRLDVSLGLKSVAALSLVLGIAIGTLGGSIGTLVATDTIGDSDITFLESEVDDIPGENGEEAPAEEEGETPEPSETEEQSANTEDVNLENARTQGNPDSEVTLVEYSSMTCPFCGRHHEDTHPTIKEEYIDTDDIQYVYKHFIRNEMDVMAGNAAECAGEQDSFFEYKEIVYDNQETLSEENLETWAEDLELDMEEWRECQENLEFQEEMIQSTQEAQGFGITGTPGFIVNDETISGAQPFTAFQTVIEENL